MIQNRASIAAAMAAGLLAACGEATLPAPAIGGGVAGGPSSYDVEDPGALALAAAEPYVRIAHPLAGAESAPASAPADAEDGGDEPGPAGDEPAGGGDAPASAPAGDDGVESAAAGDDDAPFDPSELPAGATWKVDFDTDRATFTDGRAGIALVLPSKYWDKVGVLMKGDTYSSKFRLLDKNIQAGLSYRPHAPVDPADAAAVAAFSADYTKRLEKDARDLGGELTVEETGKGTCAGAPAVVHRMAIREIGVLSASAFLHGRVYTLTVSGPSMMYKDDMATLLVEICKTLRLAKI